MVDVGRASRSRVRAVVPSSLSKMKAPVRSSDHRDREARGGLHPRWPQAARPAGNGDCHGQTLFHPVESGSRQGKRRPLLSPAALSQGMDSTPDTLKMPGLFSASHIALSACLMPLALRYLNTVSLPSSRWAQWDGIRRSPAPFAGACGCAHEEGRAPRSRRNRRRSMTAMVGPMQPSA
jgi:hypothetical protein